MKKLNVRLTFTEPVLGTWPSNQNIAREFIASKSPDAATVEDEVAALGADAVADKGMTVFPGTKPDSLFCTTTRLRASSKIPAGCWGALVARLRPARRRP